MSFKAGLRGRQPPLISPPLWGEGRGWGKINLRACKNLPLDNMWKVCYNKVSVYKATYVKRNHSYKEKFYVWNCWIYRR